MHPYTMRFADFCKSHFDLSGTIPYHYQSLSVCILDCVYSLRANYKCVTKSIVERYAAMYLGGDKNRSGDTVSMFLQHVDEAGGPTAFADTILLNHQIIGKRHKEDVCYQLAQYLSYLHIETIEDFQKFEAQDFLEIVIRAVKGISDAGVNYLFMLAGDPARCKPDVHIHHCIRDACGEDVTNEECQILFTEAVEMLKKSYPGLTVRNLDSIVWERYSKR